MFSSLKGKRTKKLKNHVLILKYEHDSEYLSVYMRILQEIFCLVSFPTWSLFIES